LIIFIFPITFLDGSKSFVAKDDSIPSTRVHLPNTLISLHSNSGCNQQVKEKNHSPACPLAPDHSHFHLLPWREGTSQSLKFSKFIHIFFVTSLTIQ
jgi:hypothetical protein